MTFEYSIVGRLDCQTKNIIYTIQYRNCQNQYFPETERSLECRIHNWVIILYGQTDSHALMMSAVEELNISTLCFLTIYLAPAFSYFQVSGKLMRYSFHCRWVAKIMIFRKSKPSLNGSKPDLSAHIV